MGMAGVAAILVVTSVTFLALPLLFLSCSVKSSLSNSGSVVSPNKSHPGSAGSRLGRATPADLVPAAEILEERLGSESDTSESQSLSPATEPQPSTDRSTGPEPELSESDSLENMNYMLELYVPSGQGMPRDPPRGDEGHGSKERHHKWQMDYTDRSKWMDECIATLTKLL